MRDIPYISKVSQKWWYLWDLTPCCLLKNFISNKESESDKTQDTRSMILLAAFNEIYETGFQAASLSNILKNTGTTKGALYHHFENKKVLGYSVLDEVIYDTINEHWIDPLENTNDPITVLTRLITTSGESMTHEDICFGCPLNNLAQEMSPIDEGFRDRIAEIYQHWQDALEKAFDRGKLAGNVKESVNSTEVALMFITSLQGCMGFAKSVQKLDSLMSCGKGLIDNLESLRPLQKTSLQKKKLKETIKRQGK